MMKSCLLWLHLLADLLYFVILNLRSRNALAAENLFLRKQLAFYQECCVRPRRTSDQARLTLLWLSRWFDWQPRISSRDAQNLYRLEPQGPPVLLASEMSVWPAADPA